jgi:phage gp46-like protein
MTDIALYWSNELWRGDWRLNERGVLADDADLGTAVMLSLFSDRTAHPDDDIPDKGPPRGWWADTFRPYPLGSRFWLLYREKKTETTRRRAEEYAREALEWFVTSGTARRVDVSARWLPHPDATGFLELEVALWPPAGERRIWRFPMAWAQLAGAGA